MATSKTSTSVRTGRSHSALLPTGAPRPSSAGDQLAAARRYLAEAGRENDPAERYAAAHLAALRAAAGVLACYPRLTVRTVRNASAWTQLARVAPAYSEWAAVFAAGSAKRQAAVAGLTRLITESDATQMLRTATEFVEIVDRSLAVAA
jgi:hypothetical protein